LLRQYLYIHKKEKKTMKHRMRAIILIITIFILLFSLQATIVVADAASVLNNAMDRIEQPLIWFWEVLPFSPGFPFLIKTLYFFMLFAILYNAAMMGFKSRIEESKGMKRALFVVTLIISIISAWWIPTNWLLTLFAWNSAILTIAFAMLVPIALYFIARALPGDENRFLRGILILLLGLFMMGVVGYMQDNPTVDQDIYDDLLWPLEIIGAVAMLAGMFMMLLGLGGGTASKAWDGFKGLVGRGGGPNRPSDGPDRQETPEERRRRRREESGGQDRPSGPRHPDGRPVIPPKRPPIPNPLVWPDGDTNPSHDPNPPSSEDLKFNIPKEDGFPHKETPKPTKYTKPITIDLSPLFLPIKNQGKSSACAAFASTSMMEAIMNKGGWDVKNELSPLFLWYVYRDNKQNNEGTRPVRLTEERITHACLEPNWPWGPLGPDSLPSRTTTAPDQNAQRDAMTRVVEKILPLDPTDPDTWVEQLEKEECPIWIAVAIPTNFIVQKAPFLYHTPQGQVLGGHAMVIVGYTNQFPHPQNTKVSVEAFKVRNSWGRNWGENGYVWIERNLLSRMLFYYPIAFKILNWNNGGAPNTPSKKPGEEPKDQLPPPDIDQIIDDLKEWTEKEQAALVTLGAVIFRFGQEETLFESNLEVLKKTSTKGEAITLLNGMIALIKGEENDIKKEYKMLKRLIGVVRRTEDGIEKLKAVADRLGINENGQPIDNDTPGWENFLALKKHVSELEKLLQDEKKSLQVIAKAANEIMGQDGLLAQAQQQSKELKRNIEVMDEEIASDQGIVDLIEEEEATYTPILKAFKAQIQMVRNLNEEVKQFAGVLAKIEEELGKLD
jgi:hypothetical protein